MNLPTFAWNRLPAFFYALLIFGLQSAAIYAEPITRVEVIKIAKAYAEHDWEATDRNVLHGKDKGGVHVDTPDGEGEGLWKKGANVGVPYKWGGFDSLKSFGDGVKAGKAAGDLYSAAKRQAGDKEVSSHAVGIDCSGFISRCWKLSQKHGTSTLSRVSDKLPDASKLKAGDIMNTSGGHVILFAKWLDEAKTRALFYEAEPFSKVIASEYDVASLVSSCFKPLRYREIRD